MADIFRPPWFQPESVNGVPLAGAKLYFYTAGTTTPITVYQDSALGTPHASPVVADASGIFPTIYVNTALYKIALYTSADVLVKSVDNVNSPSLYDSIYTKGSDVASASTIDLDSATGPFIDITGTTTVSAVTLTAGRQRMARATGAFRLAASSSLVVNGSTSVSYTTSAQDLLLFEAYSGSVVRVWVISTPLYGLTSYPPGTLYGLTLSNNSGTPLTKIDIAAGSCRDGADSANMDLLAAITAKDGTAVWAPGSSAGCLDTGAIANNTWYHGWLIGRPDTGVKDFLISTSASAPTMPTNYTLKRRVGSPFRTNGSAQFLAFVQDGDEFSWSVIQQDISATNPGTSAVTRTMTLPTGLRVKGRFSAFTNNATASTDAALILLSDLSTADAGVGSSTANAGGYSGTAAQLITGGEVCVMTNSSAQIRSRISLSTAGTTILISTHGWTDTRGRI